ncbi:DUF6077 domain-containing protein [Schauerella aestuarii]|uniref:DUF6077 domain-containing protein n=1 Tax=Schauerella aestuarii TaxID=2511204 RepID=UPI00136A9BD7|nr:DUF6077 domain-containing protein [Achromobacter aestuarii]MYZ43678.1 hypothetical protein [Achromobacter aestuarii]
MNALRLYRWIRNPLILRCRCRYISQATHVVDAIASGSGTTPVSRQIVEFLVKMRILLALFIIFFAGWTFSAHAVVVFGGTLKNLIVLAPFLIGALMWLFHLFDRPMPLSEGAKLSIPGIQRFERSQTTALRVFLLAVAPFTVALPFAFFLIYTASVLVACLMTPDTCEAPPDVHVEMRWDSWGVVLFVGIAFTMLSFAISRADLDDAFYAAVAAHAAANPEIALLSVDPMHGEVGLPMMFPSYKFASFELLAAALGWMLSLPAMSVYYVGLIPVWGAAATLATFALARELFPRRWLVGGVAAFLLMALMGEMHRAPANFSFVRIFQGKAVFLCVFLPAIFYFASRYFSDRARRSDLFLLLCCQIGAIGCSNFAMLAAPLATGGAVLSQLPNVRSRGWRPFILAMLVPLVALPYLIDVALNSRGSPILGFSNESPLSVWSTVFGTHQQYLIVLLLMAGPLLARNGPLRWALAIPPLLLFSIYLNPWFAGFISHYITTPAVYWRVVWTFPILIFGSIGIAVIMDEWRRPSVPRILRAMPVLLLVIGIALALPYNTLRHDNIGAFHGFAKDKIAKADVVLARKVIALDVGEGGRVLAPDAVAGVISRYERHPKLISVRGSYLDMLAYAMPEDEYVRRRALYDFVVSGKAANESLLRTALDQLDVNIIVMARDTITDGVRKSLATNDFFEIDATHGYVILRRG